MRSSIWLLLATITIVPCFSGGAHEEFLSRQRIYISTDESVADVLRETKKVGHVTDYAGGASARQSYEIEVHVDDDDLGEDIHEFSKSTRALDDMDSANTILIQLDQFTTAITSSTTYNFRSDRVVDDLDPSAYLSILANDPADSFGLTVLSVNSDTGTVRGFQRTRSGNVRTLDQLDASSDGTVVVGSQKTSRNFGLKMGAKAERAKFQNFTCGVQHKGEHVHPERHHRHVSVLQENLFHNSSEKAENITVGFLPRESEESDSSSNHALEGEASYRFSINLVIDVDATFIDNQGGPREAIEYVNIIVSAANVIFEHELDVHLNVIRIQEVNYLSKVSDLQEGLRVMREHYEGNFGDLNGGEGRGIALRHALLGKHIGGGIAFIDAVCDEFYAVGISSGLRGVIGGLNEDAVYDLFMFMHEIGHSLGSDHTFEKEAYDPPIDLCGEDSCPSDLPLANAATIMSYCDFCNGGLSNIALSLGGVWNGDHPRSNIDTWRESSEVVDSSVSTIPQRVSHKIWQTLFSKGTCILPQTKTPSMRPTLTPTAQPSSSPTSTPTSTYPTQKPITSTPTQRPTSSPTLRPSINSGPFTLGPKKMCDNDCYLSRGIMFDVGLSGLSNPISIKSIRFEHVNPNAYNTVDLYRTYVGTYEDKVEFDAQWTKIGSVIIPASAVKSNHVISEITLDLPVKMSPGYLLGFYLVSQESILRIGLGSNENTDYNNGVYIGAGSSIMNGIFGISVKGYILNANIQYNVLPPLENPIQSITSTSLFASPTPASVNNKSHSERI